MTSSCQADDIILLSGSSIICRAGPSSQIFAGHRPEAGREAAEDGPHRLSICQEHLMAALAFELLSEFCPRRTAGRLSAIFTAFRTLSCLVFSHPRRSIFLVPMTFNQMGSPRGGTIDKATVHFPAWQSKNVAFLNPHAAAMQSGTSQMSSPALRLCSRQEHG